MQEYQPERAANPEAVAYANVPRDRATAGVEALTAFSYAEGVLSGDTDAERVIVGNVDADLFRTLGVRPQLGRGIDAGDLGDAPARVAVLSSALWKRRYGGDRRLVGRSITMDGEQYVVIGITASDFEFPRNRAMDRDVSIWVPRRVPPPMMLRRGSRDLTAVARLGPGVTPGTLQARLASAMLSARQDNAPLNAGWQVRAVELREMVVGRVRPAVVLLTFCAGMLLLIACANASAAMLARTVVRRPAYGIRLALGASTPQLIGVVLAEAALLGIAALAVSIPLSTAARAVLLRLAPVAIPRQDGIRWTVSTALFAAAITGACALVSVVGSAAWIRRMDARAFLTESRNASGSRGRTRVLAGFILTQAALATVLLAATFTLYGRYARVNTIKPGFETSGVTTATIPMRGMRYRQASGRWNLTNQLLEKVRALPDVQSAAVASLMPLSGGLMSAGYSVRDAATDSGATAALRSVSPGFFQVLGIPLRRGRLIDASDGAQAAPVAVVNEAFAKQALRSRPALAGIVTITPPGADEPQDFTIVGVVGNAKEKDLGSVDSPIVYLSDAQASFPHTVLAIRSRGSAPVDAIRRALRELDPSLALDDVAPLDAKVRATYGLQYFQLNVLAMFAGSALVLIAVGVYGAVMFVAMADAHAMAIRLALGASPRQVATSLLRRTARWSSVGCAVGLLVIAAFQPALGLARGTADVAAIVVGASAVLIVALLATSWPSVRAGRLDAPAAINAR
jgi:putative ABC transport system permease protein